MQFDRMKRRAFITLLASAAAWTRAARAQQPRMPVSGLPFVRTARSHAASVLVSSVRCGLRELGWIRGSNVIIEYRFADSDPGRLAALANELVRLSRMRFLSQPAKLSQP
jgi:putative ABC transport system substrate-binding protein